MRAADRRAPKVLCGRESQESLPAEENQLIMAGIHNQFGDLEKARIPNGSIWGDLRYFAFSSGGPLEIGFRRILEKSRYLGG